MQNKTLKLFLIFFFGISLISFSQEINIPIEKKSYPILKNGNEIVLAVSEYAGLYKPGIGLNLSNHPDNNYSFNNPEFLVLFHFQSIKEGNWNKLESLFDNESRNNLSQIINIYEAQNAYNDFVDFELLSKSVFGKYIKLRYNFITSSGDEIPWILMAVKDDSRYYLTETMSIDHLFIDVSSVNPYNFSRVDFENINTTRLHPFYFKSNGLQLLLTYQDEKYETLGIYIKLNKYKLADVKTKPTDEIILLNNMKSSLKDTSDVAFINLWNKKNQQKFISSDFYKSRIQIQRQFYNQIDNLIPVAYLKTANELVIFYYSEKDGQRSKIQLLPMKKEDGKYKLTKKLESYYAWEILNEPDVLHEIEKYITK